MSAHIDAPPAESLIDAVLACADSVDTTVSSARVEQARRTAVADPMAVARQLRLPMRPVHLDEGWWQADTGPYVLRLADNSFAAAVPRARGYDMVTGGVVKRLSPATAAGVAVDSWSVMPALGSEPAGAAVVFRRAAGTGSRLELTVSALVAVLLACFGVAVPLLAGVVVGELVALDAISRIVVIGVILILVAVATFGLAVMQSLLIQRLVTRLDVRFTAMLLLRLVQVPLSFIQRYGPGDLQQRLQGLDEAAGQVAASVIALGSMLLLALSGIVVMVVVAPDLAVLVLLLLLALSVVAGLTVRAVVRARSRFVESSLTVSGLTLSLFTGVAKLRVAGAEGRMLSRWVAEYSHRQHAANSAAVGSQRIAVLAALTPTLVTFVVVIGSASGVTPLQLGQFTAFVAAAGQTAGALAGMLVPLTVLLGMSPLVKAVQPILQSALEQAPDTVDPGPLGGELELVSISFAYASDEAPVLDDVTLRVSPGQFVAIVGRSGSGKSTLVRLLTGLELPSAGEVRYDGRCLSDLDVEAVRRQIGVVVQSAQLATGTLLDNIIGTSNRTEDDAWTAARRAGIAADIAAMPMGMRTFVSDGASTFSGGQKQRILLARALVREPRIVILDEATSTLDNRSQQTVVASLRELNATRIVVAHRLSTIREADRVLVLDSGRITESGTFDELAAAGGLFTRLLGPQLL